MKCKFIVIIFSIFFRINAQADTIFISQKSEVDTLYISINELVINCFQSVKYDSVWANSKQKIYQNNKNEFLIKPQSVGNLQITFLGKSNGKTYKCIKKYYVDTIESPKIAINDKFEIWLTKNEILQSELKINYWFKKKIDFQIIEFEIKIPEKKAIILKGNKLKTLKKYLQKLPKESTLILYNFKYNHDTLPFTICKQNTVIVHVLD